MKVRSIFLFVMCVCGLSFGPASLSASEADVVDQRPEVIGHSRIRLFGNWRFHFEHGDDDDFWLIVKQTTQPERRIHVVEALDLVINDSNYFEGWTIDVVVEPFNNADCAVLDCPPAYIEFNLLHDWSYRLRSEDDPVDIIDDTDVLFDRLDRPGPTGPALFAVQTSLYTVNLTWDPFPGAISYLLEVGSASGLSNLIVQDIGNVTSIPHATGPPGLYFVRIRAKLDGLLTSGPSNEIGIPIGTCALLPSPPLFTATKTGSVVTLSWIEVGGGMTFRLMAGSGPHLSDLYNANVGLTSRMSVDVRTLPPGTYYVRVVAESGCGSSAPSNEIAVVVP